MIFLLFSRLQQQFQYGLNNALTLFIIKLIFADLNPHYNSPPTNVIVVQAQQQPRNTNSSRNTIPEGYRGRKS